MTSTALGSETVAAGLNPDARRVLTDFVGPVLAEHGGRQALRWRQGYRHFGITFEELGRAVHAAASHLHHEGVRPGDPVLLLGPSGPEWATALLGVVLAGGVIVPLEETSRPEFVAEVARRTRARFQVLPSGFRTAPELPRMPLEAFHPFAALGLRDQPGGSSTFESPRRRPDDLLEIVYTSGTTAHPKGVMLTHHNVISNITSLQQAMGWPAGHRVLSVLPLSHMLGQVLGLFGPLRFGGTVFFAGTRRPSVLRDCLRRERITVLVTVPAFLDRIRQQVFATAAREGRTARLERALRLARNLPYRLRRLLLRRLRGEAFPDLEFVFVGGAALGPTAEDFFDVLGIHALQGYGMTEAAPAIACNTHHAYRPYTVGRAIPGVEVRASADGEILVRGPNVTPGYLDDPEATRLLLADGWLHTGDLGSVDGDGFWKIRGRKKDVIIGPSGMNVYPEDVEAVLNELPGVRESCVVGVEEDGRMRLVGWVLPRERTDWEPRALLAQANERLASHQRLQAMERWPDPDFPRSRTLKVKRNDVLARSQGHAANEPPGSSRSPADAEDKMLVLLRECLDLPAARPVTDTQRLTADLGLDSLSRLDVLGRIEERFGADLPESAIDDQTTVGDLRRRIAEQGAGGARPQFPRWARRQAWVAARSLLSLTWRPLFRCYFSGECHGREHLARLSGPVIFIANHTSNLDTAALLAALPGKLRRRLAVAAAADYWFRPDLGPLGWLAGLIPALVYNAFPFSRTDAVEPSLRYLGELADEGWSILLYPEGTRSPTGRMVPFKGGIGLIARAIQVPIVPVALSGCFEALPKHRLLPRPARICVRFGAPCLPPFEQEPSVIASLLEQRVRELIV